MKKSLCALIIGATFFTPVLAFAADVKIYGRAHVSLDHLDDGQNYNEVGLSSNSSRLGFKVEKQIQDRLTAFAQIESQINFASGSSDNESVDFSSRDTFLGIKGDFGQLKVGRFDSPFKAARAPANLFGDQVGDLRNLTRVGNQRFDERNDNTIEYKSPKLGSGFQVAAAVALHEGTTVNENKDKGQAYDVAVTYKKEAFDVAAAYEHYASDHSRGERDGIRLAGAYKLSETMNLVGMYQYTQHDNSTTDPDAHVYGVGAQYKLNNKTSLIGHVFHRDVDANAANATLLTAGIEHRLDPQFRLYGNIATVMNDANSNLNPWAQARSNKPSSTQGVSAKGEDALGLSVGMRYDF